MVSRVLANQSLSLNVKKGQGERAKRTCAHEKNTRKIYWQIHTVKRKRINDGVGIKQEVDATNGPRNCYSALGPTSPIGHWQDPR